MMTPGPRLSTWGVREALSQVRGQGSAPRSLNHEATTTTKFHEERISKTSCVLRGLRVVVVTTHVRSASGPMVEATPPAVDRGGRSRGGRERPKGGGMV